MLEIYHPNASEKRKRWAVVEQWEGEDEGQMHVIPTFGPYHLIDKTCWCNPRMDWPACIHGEEVQ